MHTETRNAMLRWFRWILLIDVAATALVIGLGLYRGWANMGQYGQALVFAGCAVAALGVLSLSSQTAMTSDPRTLYIQERALGDVNAINRQNHLDRLQAFSSMIFLGTAGFILIAIGLILRSVA